MSQVQPQAATKHEPETWGAFINGEFKPAASGRTFPTFNPGNGEVAGYLAECDEDLRTGDHCSAEAGAGRARADSCRMRHAR